MAVCLVAPVPGWIGAAAALPEGPSGARVEISSGSGEASTPAVSGDGRFVVFAGAPSGEELGQPNPRASTIWMRDRFNDALSEVTPRDPRLTPGDSVRPAISADGCYVTFITQHAYDLFRDDDIGKRWDVYRRRNMECGGEDSGFELISIRSVVGREPAASNDVPVDDNPAISGAGGVVAYTSRFPGAAELNGVMVVDLTVPIGDPGRSRPVGGTPDRPPDTLFTYRGLRLPTVSDDGQLVGYISDARSATLERAWADGPQKGKPATSQAFIWDRSNFDPATAVAEVAATTSSADAAVEPDGETTSVRLSGDGRFAVVASRATNLVDGIAYPPCIELCPTQIYRVDRLDGSVRLVSKATTPEGRVEAANQGAILPTVNFDGNEIAFVSRSTNLFLTRNGAGTGRADDGDVLVASLDSDQLRRISLLSDGITPAPPTHSNPAMSGNGRVVSFDTSAGPGFGSLDTARAIATVMENPVLRMNDLDVGTVSVGFTSPEWYIPVRNIGPSNFVPATVVSTNEDFVVTGGTCDQRLPIPPGGSCTVNVVMLPSAEGHAEGRIEVAEAGFNAATISAAVRGTGGIPALNPTTAGVSFEPMLVGLQSPPQSIEVRNVGLSAARMNAAVIGGPLNHDFKVTADGCRGRTLEPAATCSVDVVFKPTSDGIRTASVEFSTAEFQYTTVLLSASADYYPQLIAAEPEFVAGRQAIFGVRGFRPNTVVHLYWADGRGRRAEVTTLDDGSALVALRVGAVEPAGERTIVASSDDGLQASITVRLIAPPMNRRATSPAFDD